MKLSEKAKKARAKYQRKWREKNRDKIRVYNTAYWERQAQKQESALDRAIELSEHPKSYLNSEV